MSGYCHINGTGKNRAFRQGIEAARLSPIHRCSVEALALSFGLSTGASAVPSRSLDAPDP